MNEVEHTTEAPELAQAQAAHEAGDASQVERSAEAAPELAGPRLVNVAEAIHYRKRAQAAEQELTELRTRLDEAQRQSQAMQQRLEQAERRAAIDAQLIEAGAADMQAARLLVEANLIKADDTDVNAAIESVRRERPQLFRSAVRSAATAAMGLAVHAADQGRRDIRRAAAIARASGHNADVMHYMNLRRSAPR